MTTRRQWLQHGAALALAGALPARAAAPFPTRPVRVFTPFPAGSGPDASLRLVAEQLSRRWQQPVVIENKPGGNGFIAVAAFKQGARDGHDLLQLDSTHATTHPTTFSRLPYQVQADFAPLHMLLRTPFFVAVGADSPWRSLDELVADARRQPGRLSYGSWFNGSPGHIGGLLLQSQQQLSMLHVPFRDFGQLYSAVAMREVDWALASAATGSAMQKAGRIRFLALAADARDPLYPQVPCTAELPALREFAISAWAGLFAPAAIAPARQQSIAADIAQALATPAVRQAYATLGYESPALATARFDAVIRSETAHWAGIVTAAHLKLD